MYVEDARVRFSLGKPTNLTGYSQFSSDPPAKCQRSTINYAMTTSIRGRDSSVGIATRYGLDRPGIEFW
jgi:hypothetical protein